MVGQFLKSIIAKIKFILSDRKSGDLAYALTIVISFLIVVLGINLFVELTSKVKNEMMGSFDEQVTNYVLSFRNDTLTDYFVFVTDVGDVNGYLIILLITVILSWLVFKKWKYVWQITLVLALATLSNMMLKRFIDRARPEIEHLVSVKTLSFPSGHAMSSMAFYGFLIYLIYKLKIHRALKAVFITLFSILILSIGLSRIYLGVHFPSDVAGGWIAGLIWVFFCILIFNIVEIYRRDPST